MDNYLFEVSIGPVQDFIASARRTRDLKFGSWLLSELSKAAAKQIADSQGKLIFPSPQNESELQAYTPLNVANKIIAHITGSPQTLGELVHVAVKTRLVSITEDAYKGLGYFNKLVAGQQVEDLVEFAWVAVPYNAHAGEYQTKRQQLEALLSARKNTRNFQAVPWGLPIPKSSITGQLESVIDESLYPSSRSRLTPKEERENLEKSRNLYNRYGAGPAERLSGVDLLKRHGNFSKNTKENSSTIPDNTVSGFPSTSHVAALPFLKRLDHIPPEDKSRAKELWTKYIAQLSALKEGDNKKLDRIPHGFKHHTILQDYDGSLLFEERWVDLFENFVDMQKIKEDKRIKPAQDALKDFFLFADEVLGKKRPSPYYALLLADGDNMGKVIDHQTEESEHRQLSQTLDGFATEATQIVKDHDGVLVYAGGDDVLALLPLHQVLYCAKKLADTFNNRLSSFKDAYDNQSTLSVGIAIIHHLSPLRDALSTARAAEKQAKQVDGKNALAVIINKRSGGERTIAAQWDSLYKYLEELIKYCEKEAIPDGMAYELESVMQRLTFSSPDAKPQEDQSENAKAQEAQITWEIIGKEVARILKRKLTTLQRRVPKTCGAKIEQTLLERFEQAQPKTITDIRNTIEQFINELIVAQTFADARQLALMDKEQ